MMSVIGSSTASCCEAYNYGYVTLLGAVRHNFTV